jgi:hypothetical protein
MPFKPVKSNPIFRKLFKVVFSVQTGLYAENQRSDKARFSGRFAPAAVFAARQNKQREEHRANLQQEQDNKQDTPHRCLCKYDIRVR